MGRGAIIGVIGTLALLLAAGAWAAFVQIGLLNTQLGAAQAANQTLIQEIEDAELEKEKGEAREASLDQSVMGMIEERRRLERQAQDWKRRYQEVINGDDDCKAWAATRLPRCISDGLLPGTPGAGAHHRPAGSGAPVHDGTDPAANR